MHRPSVHFNQCKQTLASCPPVEIKPNMAAAQQKSSCIFYSRGVVLLVGRLYVSLCALWITDLFAAEISVLIFCRLTAVVLLGSIEVR